MLNDDNLEVVVVGSVKKDDDDEEDDEEDDKVDGNNRFRDGDIPLLLLLLFRFRIDLYVLTDLDGDTRKESSFSSLILNLLLYLVWFCCSCALESIFHNANLLSPAPEQT